MDETEIVEETFTKPEPGTVVFLKSEAVRDMVNHSSFITHYTLGIANVS